VGCPQLYNRTHLIPGLWRWGHRIACELGLYDEIKGKAGLEVEKRVP